MAEPLLADRSSVAGSPQSGTLQLVCAVAVALALNAGTLKATGLPGPDLTVTTTIIASGTAVFFVSVTGRVPARRLLLAYWLLCLVAVLAAFPVLVDIGPNHEYATRKVLGILGVTLPLAGAAALMLSSSARTVTRQLYTALSWVGIVASVLIIGGLGTEVSGRTGLGGGNPILVGRTVGLGIACSTSLWVTGHWRLRWLLLSAALGSPALWLTQTRAPLLVAVGCLALGVVIKLRAAPGNARPALRFKAVALVVITAATAFVGMRQVVETATTRPRLAAMISSGSLFGSEARIDLWRDALRAIDGSPLGLGWGRYAEVSTSGRDYPHSLPLELAVEGGIVVAVLALAGLALVVGMCITGPTLTKAAGLPLVFAIVNALVSGDVNGNRAVVVLALVAASVARLSRPSATNGDHALSAGGAR